MTDPLAKEEFAAFAGVSREALARLEDYLALLSRWQRAINLVGPATLADPWRRHMLDSAQLLRVIPKEADALYDLGSGAGLPGLILAIMGQPGVHLVESDHRKAQFLREVVRLLELPVEVHVQRIESLPPSCADVVVARALAPLPRLIDLAFPLLRPGAVCLFLKGKTAAEELTEASKCWSMRTLSYPSLSNPSGSVLQLRDIVRAPLHRQ